MKIVFDENEQGMARANTIVALTYAVSCLKADAESWTRLSEDHGNTDKERQIQNIERGFAADDEKYISILESLLGTV